MTGRAVSPVNEVDRLTARNTDTNRIGYAGSKLNNNDLSVSSTCEFLPSFSLHCPYNVPRGVSKLAAANTSNGIGVDVEAAEKDTLTKANTPTTGNSLGLDIQADDVGYIATVQMGTPPREFKLLMDSGSADLWVGAEGCKSVTGGDCVSFTLDLFPPLSTCSSLLCCRATMCFSVHNHRLHLLIHKSPSM